jgi:hypothetical protein
MIARAFNPMPSIAVTHLGNAGNRLFQYFFCAELARRSGITSVCGLDIPEFGIQSPSVSLAGRVIQTAPGHLYNVADLAYKLRNGIYDCVNFVGYAHRLEYYPDLEFLRTLLPAPREQSHQPPGERDLVINIRGAEILGRAHSSYGPPPISFYEHLVRSTGLTPVFVGQVGDDFYSQELRRRFDGCRFVESHGAASDFAFMQAAKNLVVAVSTFSWLAAWLSVHAEHIYLPVSGFLNPLQRPDINLCPVSDERYSFHEFPVLHWEGTSRQQSELLTGPYAGRTLSRAELAKRIP